MRSTLNRSHDKWKPLPAGWSSAAVMQEVELPNGTAWTDVEETISKIHSSKLDYAKPLWSVYLIKGFEDKQILFWRFHHAMGDG